MQIKAVVFDLEGTLFSSSKLGKRHMTQVLNIVSRRLDIAKKESLKQLVSKRKELSAKLGYAPPLTTVVEAFGISRQDFFETISRVDPRPYIKVDTKLTRMLKRLRRIGLKLALLTNVSSPYTLRVLEALGIETSMFDYLITGSDMKEIKPDLSPFLSVMKSLNLPSKQILMVGDRVAVDLAPAKKLGMRTALVTEERVGLRNQNTTIDIILQSANELAAVLECC